MKDPVINVIYKSNLIITCWPTCRCIHDCVKGNLQCTCSDCTIYHIIKRYCVDEQYNYNLLLLTTMLEISNLAPCNTFCIMDPRLYHVTESSE